MLFLDSEFDKDEKNFGQNIDNIENNNRLRNLNELIVNFDIPRSKTHKVKSSSSESDQNLDDLLLSDDEIPINTA